MAIDTLAKRSATLRFGRPGLAATRPPSGTIAAFDRGALLGCYYLEGAASVAPTDGWAATPLSRSVVGSADRAVKASGITRVVWAKGQGR